MPILIAFGQGFAYAAGACVANWLFSQILSED